MGDLLLGFGICGPSANPRKLTLSHVDSNPITLTRDHSIYFVEYIYYRLLPSVSLHNLLYFLTAHFLSFLLHFNYQTQSGPLGIPQAITLLL